jgi:glutamine amidotransferase
MNLVLIDSPVANVANIERALVTVGANVTLTADPDRIATAPKIVLPGVGSFAAAMRWIERRGVVEALRSAVANGAWLLGICVGHQVLFEDSDEDGHWRGLGLLPGSVRRFPGALPVPQIGWNRVTTSGDAHRLFIGIPTGTPFYFVNSFRVSDASSEIASSEYGGRFTAAAARDRIAGLQFHPEKSSTAGLRVLRNFVEIA